MTKGNKDTQWSTVMVGYFTPVSCPAPGMFQLPVENDWDCTERYLFILNWLAHERTKEANKEEEKARAIRQERILTRMHQKTEEFSPKPPPARKVRRIILLHPQPRKQSMRMRVK